MVMARLHLICGNCGNGDKEMMELSISENLFAEEERYGISLCCTNCSTIHSLTEEVKNNNITINECEGERK